MRPWKARSIAITSSGVMSSASVVKPTRSANRTPTDWRRTRPSGSSRSASSSTTLGEKYRARLERSRSASARSATRMRERRTSSASPAATTTNAMISLSYLSSETKFGSRYMVSPLGRSSAGALPVATPGRVTTHRNASVHATAPHSPVHSSRRGRNENAICISRTKKNTKLP